MSAGKGGTWKIAVVLLGCHSAARGQVPASAGRLGRWYVGAGAAAHKYYARHLPFSEIYPAYVAAGYFLTPRLAVQAKLQYGERTHLSGGVTSVSNGQTFRFQAQARIHSTALTVVLRRGLSRPQRRWQFEGLLGLAVVHGRSTETLTATTPAGTQRSALPSNQSTEPHLVGGLGMSYWLGARWAVGAEVLANINLLLPPSVARGTGMGSGANAGITYRFGPAKP